MVTFCIFAAFFAIVWGTECPAYVGIPLAILTVIAAILSL